MRVCTRVVIAVAVLALMGSVPEPAASQSTQEIQSAMGLLGAQDFQGAATLLEGVVETDSENGRAWSLLGYSYRALQRQDEAIQAYKKAVELPGSGPSALFNLGFTLLNAGQLDEGFDWILKAKDSGAYDVTQIDLSPAAGALRDDPRYKTLFPSEAEFGDPFVEPVEIIHEWRGASINDQFGWIARNIGDVDGDGVHDVTTSAPTLQVDGTPAGRVYTYSGRTGDLLWTADGAPGDQLGLGIEAAGDVNGDGIPDVIAGAPFGNKAVVFAGHDGSVVRVMESPEPGELFGRKVSDIGDVDGDGHDDVLVGAPQNNANGQGSGRVYVFSGKSGDVLLTLDGAEAGDAFGSSAGGHVGEDGLVTLIVGAPNAGPGDRGATYVYHGLTDEPAFVIESDEAGAQLGAMFVSAVGDVNADGVVDVYASDFSANTTAAGSGRVYVYSGADGERLFDLHGTSAGEGFGIGVADAGDVDGDGHDDLLIGAWQHASAAASGGKVYLYSGKDGALKREMTGKVMGETFGFDATGMGDVNGDGVIDYLITSAWSAVSGGHSGRMYIISGATR